MEDPTRPPSPPFQPGLPWDETRTGRSTTDDDAPEAAQASPQEREGVVNGPETPEALPVAAPTAAESARSDTAAVVEAPVPDRGISGGGGGLPPGSSFGGGGDDGGEGEEEPMAKMSFLEHLEELRRRLIHSLAAVFVGFCICFWFSQKIFEYLAKPVTDVLHKLKMPDKLYFTHPADAFNVFLQIGFIAGLFLASPYVLYQVWVFIAPGLYKRERRYAAPFVLFCSGLFIAGGLFGYFIAFPYALEFLLSMGGERLTPWLTAKEYLDLFTTIILGLGIIFEMPVLILFLSLLRIVTPGFLLRNFRYAVLIMTIIAAIVTPTTDVTNQILFAVPMLGLYLLGAGLAWLVTRQREKKQKARGQNRT